LTTRQVNGQTPGRHRISELQNTGDTASAAGDFDVPDWFLEPGDDTGEVPEAVSNTLATHVKTSGKQSTADNDEPKSGPPTLDEWERFFAKFVLRVLCDYYIDFAFRNVDENALSARDIERIKLTDEEKKRITVPFSELANKSKFMRKHGRIIVASGESLDSALTLGIWFNRVNKIAAKHRPVTAKVKQPRQRGGGENVSAGQGSPEQPEPSANGAGKWPQGIVIERDGFS
jgi:hypothetical protein